MEDNKPIQETSIFNCKNCGKTCTRYLQGKFASGRDKKWVDDSGKLTNGKTCGTCHAEKVAQRKRLKKLAQDNLNKTLDALIKDEGWDE